ncbi:voltage-gated potassium channel [Methanobacterium petrolearium]|nr:voltage-gated potassium channel [Methanobacterium petrolearium]
MKQKIMMLMELIFITFIFLDGFLLFVSIFLPIRPMAFTIVIYLDLFTSILLIFGYFIQMRRRKKGLYIKRNWNGLISIMPFYFIGIILLGMNETSVILKILCLIKIFALAFSARQVGKSVDEFVEKSKLVYGFAFFVVVLIFCSVLFFLLESGVNPEVATYEDSLWYVIQTITTVGYGDVVPITQWGRLVGVIAMISAIAISSLLTAATTSSLMDKLREDREKLAKKSGDYIKDLEIRIYDLESKMAKEKNIEEVKSDLNSIRSEISELKDLLSKKE